MCVSVHLLSSASICGESMSMATCCRDRQTLRSERALFDCRGPSRYVDHVVSAPMAMFTPLLFHRRNDLGGISSNGPGLIVHRPLVRKPREPWPVVIDLSETPGPEKTLATISAALPPLIAAKKEVGNWRQHVLLSGVSINQAPRLKSSLSGGRWSSRKDEFPLLTMYHLKFFIFFNISKIIYFHVIYQSKFFFYILKNIVTTK